ncbi:hypothetical protein [Protaetiibacter intestinalis]|uniref:Uncharacterized protein n=1 Tax=Protaetiibacter intestinalis TaxID=2419774 RepID=A0A387BDL8_9MICO|nr:hypothetical protein [Protaetiibacter intestinalis]AYF99146.1 hypothetical protein D7I47_13370 [Protaetiibacter intestinalis]
MPDDALLLNDADVAAGCALDARYGGMLPYGPPLFREYFLAAVARSLPHYACAPNLLEAEWKRGRAAENEAEAERRRPSGRRVHTLAEAEELRGRLQR